MRVKSCAHIYTSAPSPLQVKSVVVHLLSLLSPRPSEIFVDRCESISANLNSKMARKSLLTLLSLCFFLHLPNVLAWGTLGHRTVAYLAEMYLNDASKTWVSNWLEGDDISDAALWA